MEVDLPASVEPPMNAALVGILTATSGQTMSHHRPAGPIPNSWPRKLR